MYHRFFDRWYSDDARRLQQSRATRPDVVSFPEFVGRTVQEICPLTDVAAAEARRRVGMMRNAAEGDWPRHLSVRPPVDLDWIRSFDAHYDLDRVEALSARSDPADFSNDYLVTVCEFGAILGTVMTDLLPRVEWLPSWPYWETSIFDSATGSVIPVFHWSIKKFSTYGIDDGFAAKIEACIQMLRDPPSAT
jgi:hypothetical protein